MYNKIILQYGGGYGQVDQIALALNVNHNEWFFNESDMPINMRYAPAILVGLQGRYSVDSKNAILFNLNAAKINITGNFTITTIPPSNSSQINNSIKTFAIKGVEQRMLLQAGYQRVTGESDKINFFIEGGLNITLAKFAKNEILINSLFIDLTSDFQQPGLDPYYSRKPVGVGFGTFSGVGMNMNVNQEWRIQFLYNLAYEDINIRKNTSLKFQHAIGVRGYYCL